MSNFIEIQQVFCRFFLEVITLRNDPQDEHLSQLKMLFTGWGRKTPTKDGDSDDF